ncbi:MAG: hypothetical protein ACI9FU_002329 [Granulosicoccus sp.]|jgi:hypothetical protein
MAALLLPLLWLNHSTSHDWGGDFAMYLMQARNLVEGLPQTQHGYIYNPDFARNGPAVYPVGYPILLSPIYALWGNNMEAFSTFQSILAILFGFTFFYFLKRHFSWIGSLVLVLVVAYHPWFLYFKRELMSDIPFAMLVLWLLMAVRSKQPPWIVALIMISMILMRGIGWFSIPALLLAEGTQFVYNWTKKGPLWNALKICGATAISVIILNRLVFDIPLTTQSYADQLLPADILENIVGNFVYFKDVLTDHLSLGLTKSETFNSTIVLIYIALILVGSIISFRQNSIYTWALVVYLAIILIYPYRFSGFRFILPIHGIMMLLAGIGFLKIIPKRIAKYWILLLAVIWYMRNNVEWWQSIAENQAIIQIGPQQLKSEEFIQFIKNEPGEIQPIIFIKPRVINLYTNRSSVSNEPMGNPSEITDLILQHEVKGLVLCKDLPHASLESYIRNNQNELELKFQNNRFQYFVTK